MFARHAANRQDPALGAVIRLTWRLADAPVRWLWRRFSPVTLGARAMIQNTEGHVLLVRRSVDGCWYLPGVGVHRGETLLEAVAREVREETGLAITPEDATVFGVYSSFLEGKSDHIVVFACTTHGEPHPDGLEIDAVAYWELADWPENVSPGTKRRLAELVAASSGPVINPW